MEWSKFIIVVIVLYVAYYGFNFIFDALKGNKTSNKDEVEPLTFEDDTPVKTVDGFGEASIKQSKKSVSVDNDEVIPLTYTDDKISKTVVDIDNLSINHLPVSVEDSESDNTINGVINDEIITNKERKEENFKPDESEVLESENMIKATGKIKVITDKIISGGISYKDLIKEASRGAILQSAKINFGEEA